MTSNKEGRLLLASKAIKLGQFKSIRRAAEVYNVSRTTLGAQLVGRPTRSDCTPNSRILTSYEETAIIQYILDLDSRGFPPRPDEIREMAELLLAERGNRPTGKTVDLKFHQTTQRD
jgi:hypothetical protein